MGEDILEGIGELEGIDVAQMELNDGVVDELKDRGRCCC